MILYAIVVLRRLAQWHLLLIVNNNRIKNKRKAILHLIEELKKMQPKYHKLILSGILFGFLKFTHCYGVIKIVKYGAKIYSKFKTNILIE